jgi:serine/threonine-protein kinase RsbW
MEAVTSNGFSPDACFYVKLAMEEAVVNAIKHGNRLDASKRVHLRYACDHDRFMLSVRDEGDGFDPSKVPDPTAPENLALPYGRGLMLMKSYMDSVEWSKNGREVTLVKLNR